MKKKLKKKNPLSKAQARLLKESLKNLLGTGLIQQEKEENNSPLRNILLRDALNKMILE